ncbi:MAG: DUF1569 domain-containing protein [Bacteroidota bacterium]
MQSIFHPQTIDSFKKRIQKIDPNANAQWGKMNTFQMLKHCSENDRMLLRQRQLRRLFIGRLFGKMALRSNIKDDKPLSKNSPTHPDLVIRDNGDAEAQKKIWLSLLDQYPSMQTSDYVDFVHPFFGKMSAGQVGKFAFKHIDHHLRQFGV